MVAFWLQKGWAGQRQTTRVTRTTRKGVSERTLTFGFSKGERVRCWRGDQRLLLASTTVSAVMFTILRTVVLAVRM